MDMAIVYIYECKNCQRVYPRVAGQPLACPFCQSHEREEIGNGFPTLELVDNLINSLPWERLNEIFLNIQNRKEQDNG